MKKYMGSCLCKKVAFEVLGEFSGFFLCHCSRCRKVTGTAHGANLFSKSAEFHWLSGKESVKIFRLPDTRFAKAFCESCGSGLPIEEHGRLLVPAGSLDSDLDLRPDAHIFIGSKANWDCDLGSAPEFEGLPK